MKIGEDGGKLKLMKIDENGRNLNWWNTTLMKIVDENLMKIDEDWWTLKLMKPDENCGSSK